MRYLHLRHPARTTLADARAIWPLTKLCEFAGTWLARHKRWAVLIATGFGAVDLGVNLSTTEEGGGVRSLLLTGGIVGVYLALAYGLKYGPALLQGKKRGMAEATNLNLMEDYRKQRQRRYLEPMWDDALRDAPFGDFAALYANDPGEADEDGETPGLERLAAAADEDRRALFMEIADRLLDSASSQPEQERHLGTGMEMLEDLFDAGPFTVSDRKLEQNYDGHPRLLEARRLARERWTDPLHELVKRQAADLWFRFLRSSVSAHVGQAVGELNERYDNTINAQRLLWPGTERISLGGLDRATASRARGEIREAQRALMHERLGADGATARRKLERAIGPMVELAATLRIRFDPDYVLGHIGDVAGDIADVEPRLTTDLATHRAAVKDVLERFERWLDAAGPPLATREQRSSIRIAFYVNFEGMRDAFFAAPDDTAPGRDPAFRVPFCCVAGRPHPWTQMLTDVRLLHVLAAVRRREYEGLVAALGGYPAPLGGGTG